MRKLLIGYDGSEHAAAAIDDLQRAGLPPDIEAIVLTVADAFYPPAVDPKDWGSSPLDQKIRERAEEMRARAMKARDEAYSVASGGAARLQELFPSWAVRAETDINWPGWGIISKAEEWALTWWLSAPESIRSLNEYNSAVYCERFSEAANARCEWGGVRPDTPTL
jgi:hypothetical protein